MKNITLNKLLSVLERNDPEELHDNLPYWPGYEPDKRTNLDLDDLVAVYPKDRTKPAYFGYTRVYLVNNQRTPHKTLYGFGPSDLVFQASITLYRFAPNLQCWQLIANGHKHHQDHCKSIEPNYFPENAYVPHEKDAPGEGELLLMKKQHLDLYLTMHNEAVNNKTDLMRRDRIDGVNIDSRPLSHDEMSSILQRAKSTKIDMLTIGNSFYGASYTRYIEEYEQDIKELLLIRELAECPIQIIPCDVNMQKMQKEVSDLARGRIFERKLVAAESKISSLIEDLAERESKLEYYVQLTIAQQAEIESKRILQESHAILEKVNEQLQSELESLSHQNQALLDYQRQQESELVSLKHINQKLDNALRHGIQEIHAERDRKVKEVEDKAAEDVRKAQAVQTLSRYTLPQIVNQYLELNSDIVTELTDPKRHSELHHLNLIRWSEHKDLIAVKPLIESKEEGPIFSVEALVERITEVNEESSLYDTQALLFAIDQLIVDFKKSYHLLPVSAKNALNVLIDKKGIETKYQRHRVSLIGSESEKFLSGEWGSIDSEEQKIYEATFTQAISNISEPDQELYADYLTDTHSLLESLRNRHSDAVEDDGRENLDELAKSLRLEMAKILRGSNPDFKKQEAIKRVLKSYNMNWKNIPDSLDKMIIQFTLDKLYALKDKLKNIYSLSTDPEFDLDEDVTSALMNNNFLVKYRPSICTNDKIAPYQVKIGRQ